MARVNVTYTEDDDEIKIGWFDPYAAVEAIDEDTRWDGNNNVSVHGGQYEHEKLYRTPGGRWVLHHWSQWQGSQEAYRFIDDEAAKQWLLINHDDEIIERYFGELSSESGPTQTRESLIAERERVSIRLAEIDGILGAMIAKEIEAH